MSEFDFEVVSHKGKYKVVFEAPFAGLEEGLAPHEHLIIDQKVAELYAGPLQKALASPRVLQIEANEKNKSLEKMSEYVLHLTENGIKRGHRIVAIGGGVIQDITSFIAAVLFRGMEWRFYPTTLLAQADSCIGSKSSVNVGGYKNQVGTFTPPQSISIATDVLETLTPADFLSGVGEMLKVHAIAGWNDFRQVAKDYSRLRGDKKLLRKTIKRSLEIKKTLIEKDEFDKNERLILNYGHTFGHAIESATEYEIPHGIAVTIGMDMANTFSKAFGFIDEATFQELHVPLAQNYQGFARVSIPKEKYFNAFLKDKKHSDKGLALILMRGPGKVFRDFYPREEKIENLAETFLRNFGKRN